MGVSTEVELCNLALSRIGADTITSLTADSAKEDRLCNQFYAKIRDQLLRSFAWNFALKVTPLQLVDLFDMSTSYSDAISITNIATSNPVVVTASNNYASGYIIKLYDISGTTELNDRLFEVSGPNTASFALLDVDGGQYTTYTSGGYAVRQEPMSAYEDGYTYIVPSDCLKPMRLDSNEEFQILGDINGMRLVTTDDDAVLIYMAHITDVTKFPDDFIEVLVSRLARELIMPIIGTRDGAIVRRELTQDLQGAMSVARKNNCNAQMMKYSFKSTWADARK